MQLSKCSHMGCDNAPHYLSINERDQRAVAAFCFGHGTKINEQPIPGFHLEQIPNANAEELRRMSQTPPSPPAIASTATAPPSAMAPPNAIFDDAEIFGENEAAGNSEVPTTDEMSTNFFWKYGKNEIFKLQTTVRGAPSAHKITRNIEAAIDAMQIILQKGGHAEFAQAPGVHTQVTAAPSVASPPPVPVNAPAPAQATPVAPIPPASGEEEARPAPAYSDPLNKQPGAGPFYFTATKCTVKHDRTDGKITVDLYTQGGKFPQVKIVRTPEEVAQAFSKCGAWTPEHFARTTEYPINYRVIYRHSTTTTQQGNPYRNVVDIMPLT